MQADRERKFVVRFAVGDQRGVRSSSWLPPVFPAFSPVHHFVESLSDWMPLQPA
jgi:hypothetical protein